MKKEIGVSLTRKTGQMILTIGLAVAAITGTNKLHGQVVPNTVPLTMPEVPGATPDENLALKIYRAFYYDPRVVSAFAQVGVTNGVATLSGSVQNQEARAIAEQLASRTAGVNRVINLLEVGPIRAEPSDEEIYRNVRNAFGTDRQLRDNDIKVGVLNGRVYLAGPVGNVFMRAKAANLAAEVPGVAGVENALTVAQGYHVNGESWTPGGFYHKKTKTDDARLRKEIDKRYTSTAFAPGEKVNVRIENGEVTLTGTVASEEQRNALVRDAYAAGAKTVRDELSVMPPTFVARQKTTTNDQ